MPGRTSCSRSAIRSLARAPPVTRYTSSSRCGACMSRSPGRQAIDGRAEARHPQEFVKAGLADPATFWLSSSSWKTCQALSRHSFEFSPGMTEMIRNGRHRRASGASGRAAHACRGGPAKLRGPETAGTWGRWPGELRAAMGFSTRQIHRRRRAGSGYPAPSSRRSTRRRRTYRTLWMSTWPRVIRTRVRRIPTVRALEQKLASAGRAAPTRTCYRHRHGCGERAVSWPA